MVRPGRLRLLMLVWWCVVTASAPKLGAQGRVRADAAAVINEILASNREAVEDPQGDYDDWIELYNPGRTAIDVGGMYLTDDAALPTKWQIPTDQAEATTIESLGYLLIWADGDLTASGLHAGFKLDADGEELHLIAADGVTVLDSIEFGPQVVDVSYGRYPDGDPNLRHMAEPTPGATNSEVYEGIAAEPEFSIQGCLCRETLTLTLSTETPDATIYYTLDGREPFGVDRERPGGFTYAGPISVNFTTTVKAVTWRPGWRHSRIRTERYTFIDADLQDFSSPLPIAVVDTLAANIASSQVPAYSYFIDTGRGGRASMTGETDFAGWAGINVRGKSSEGFAKKQYHFETWDEDNRDQAVSILGFPADADWVLQGPYSDKSLMRNVLAYRWSRELGRYAPRTRFIELFLNTSGTVSMDDYVGVYVFMEKIKIAPDRVDVPQLEPTDNAEPEITGGYIIKKDKFDGGDATFTTSTGQTLIHEDPGGDDLTQEQRRWIRDYVNAFEGALYGSNFTDPIEGYAAFIDVGSFVDHHIVVELCKNIDGFRLSTYMSKARNGKLCMGPVWDYNLSLGNANYLNGWIPSGWYFDQLGNSEYPWWRRLFEDPEFRLAYADRWFAARRDLFTTERLLGIVDDYAALLDEPQQRNFDRWRILGRYVWPNWYLAQTYQEEIEWMKDWLADRLEWMDGQVGRDMAPAPPAFSRQGGHIEPGELLAMASSSGRIYYSLDGSDPRWIDPAAAATRNTVLIEENAAKRVLVPTGPVDEAWRGGAVFDDSAWTPVSRRGSGGAGYERSTGYEDYISLDLGEQMYGVQSGCYLRIPFVLSESSDQFDRLTLRVRYDDGFVAYLNGVEVARRNISGTPAWNAGADSQHDDIDATGLEPIEIAGFADLLRETDNVLALHALNVSSTSSDFLISVELVGIVLVETDTPGVVNEYGEPLVLTASTHVKARALIGTTWSALNEAMFAVGPVAESLRISELMYHPAETGDPEDPNTEYVELVNIGNETIDLNLVAFTDGIEFVFPSVELAPGAHTLVVKDIAAFEAAYGPGLPVAGQYTGSLNNGGERLRLADAAGEMIHDFAFRDDWYDVTDGDGFSLTLVDPIATTVEAWGNQTSWRPSTEVGGSPGTDD